MMPRIETDRYRGPKDTDSTVIRRLINASEFERVNRPPEDPLEREIIEAIREGIVIFIAEENLIAVPQ